MTVDESFLVLFFKKEPLARTKARKRFFLKKEAKTFFPFTVDDPHSHSC
jgi:hypothetical protein